MEQGGHTGFHCQPNCLRTHILKLNHNLGKIQTKTLSEYKVQMQIHHMCRMSSRYENVVSVCPLIIYVDACVCVCSPAPVKLHILCLIPGMHKRFLSLITLYPVHECSCLVYRISVYTFLVEERGRKCMIYVRTCWGV